MWRSLDPAYPTNLAIVLWVGLAWWLWGSSSGLAIFFAWALTRELDPDRPLSALLAALLATLWGGYSSGLFLLLLGMRFVSRTPGVPARPLDSLLLLGLAWTRPNVAWIAAAAFFLDAALEKPLRRHLIFGALALVPMAQSSALTGAGLCRELSWGLLLCLSFLSLCLNGEAPATGGDENGRSLDYSRVLSSQLLAVLSALLSVWCWQAVGVYAWWSLWSGLFAVVFWRAASWIWSHRPGTPMGPQTITGPGEFDSEPAYRPA